MKYLPKKRHQRKIPTITAWAPRPAWGCTAQLDVSGTKDKSITQAEK